jgi:Neuraminidase (sialidase)
MTRKWRNAAIVILILIAWDAASLYAQALFEQTEVFAGGQDDINTYRIPSLICTKNGTLLAFSEGRKDSSADGSPTDLVLKRSLGNAGMWTPENALLFHTGGRSRRNIMMWQPMQTLIHSLHGEAYMNPVPVIDRADGTIYLLVNDYPQPWADLPAEILIIKSTDEGATWSSSVNITSSVGRNELGPGVGIQLRSGKLVVPLYDGVIFSDDHGKNWRAGSKAAGIADEAQVVELADGSLMLNRRSRHNRTVIMSKDDGQTWGEPSLDPVLTDPFCQGSIIRYTRQDEGFSKDRILFSNPGDPNDRLNLTVRVSYDEGKTWPVAKTINNGTAAYSSMTIFPDGSIGILYESGNTYDGFAEHYGKVIFARFNWEWLTGGEDRLEKATKAN